MKEWVWMREGMTKRVVIYAPSCSFMKSNNNSEEWAQEKRKHSDTKRQFTPVRGSTEASGQMNYTKKKGFVVTL